MRFLAYESSRSVPNIVVDGSPNQSTVLTLTHWPGIAQPDGLGDDLSAQMAFHYLDRRPPHPPAEVVTNNHFDQDGLVSVHALVDPERSLGHRDLLIDVAAAGDFGTYRFRNAARASMAIARIGECGDGNSDEGVAANYERALPLLLPMVLDPDRFRDDWAEEDEQLETSEEALRSGAATVTEHGDAGLAVVDVPDHLGDLGGHRFGGMRFEGLHPMAINNATESMRLLVVRGRRYQYTDRYETWVQYRSRRLPRRVDLQPLADELTAAETGSVTWSADRPGSLTPRLTHDGESTIAAAEVVAAITGHLGSAEPAWDPFPPGH